MQPTAPSQGIPVGIGKSKAYLLAGFANAVAEETGTNSSQEKPKTQEMRIWKRERGKFISSARSQERWQAQALTTDLSTRKMDTQSFIRRVSGRYMQGGRQRAHDHGWELLLCV